MISYLPVGEVGLSDGATVGITARSTTDLRRTFIEGFRLFAPNEQTLPP
jgi:hypothetical protein